MGRGEVEVVFVYSDAETARHGRTLSNSGFRCKGKADNKTPFLDLDIREDYERLKKL
jgi:hypothetical protein